MNEDHSLIECSTHYTTVPIKPESEGSAHRKRASDATFQSPFPTGQQQCMRTWRLLFIVAVFCISGVLCYIAMNRYSGDSSRDLLNEGRFLHQRSESPSVDKIDFLVIVFGWRRAASMERLLKSLARADYQGHSMSLHIHLDASPAPQVMKLVQSFQWPHGPKETFLAPRRKGLEKMVAESWNATSDCQYAFFFEDDIEAQPDYFKFALNVLKEMKKSPSTTLSIVGIALNTPRFDEVSSRHAVWIPEWEIGKESNLFLFQQPCSWGALYFPWAWKRFLIYHHLRKELFPDFPLIPESSVNSWTRSWKRYLMELMLLDASLMVYPSFPEQASFSCHHREIGEHVSYPGWSASVDELVNFKIDYYFTPLMKLNRNWQIRPFELNRLPVISFYHFKVESVDDLRKFGRLLAEKLRESGLDWE